MRKTITIIFVSFFLGGFVGFLFFTFIEMNKIANQVKVIVERDWLENKIFPHAVKEMYRGEKNTVFTSLLKTIEFVFKNENNVVIGFEFYTESAFQGYAKIRQNENIIEGFDIYSIYDTTLYDFLIPTKTIDFFYHDGFTLIYDGIQNELYIVMSDKNFQRIEKGIVPKTWSDFIYDASKILSE